MPTQKPAIVKGANLTVTVNNLLFSYSDEGPETAPAILFIHGYPFNRAMWKLQTDELKKDYRVIAYDVRGHGSTESGEEKFSIALFAQDLILFMDALSLRKSIVCGLSMGGYIALRAQVNYPERFHALVLCDTQCTEDPIEVKEQRSKATADMARNGTEEFINKTIGQLFSAESLISKFQEIETIRAMMVQTSVETLCDTLVAFSERSETCSTLNKIGIPVLILVGSEDQITPPQCSRLMASKIPDSKMFTIPLSGHLPNLENPKEFNLHFLEFIHREMNKTQPAQMSGASHKVPVT
jgi:3-oxoadipate enol-lactonase